MKSFNRHLTEPDQCLYLPEQTSRLDYDFVSELTTEEYGKLVREGWRKFGFALFRPQCPACSACQPIRVIVDRFHQSRSQKRTLKSNQDLRLSIGQGEYSDEKLSLYLRHHFSRAGTIGWSAPTVESALEHLMMLPEGPCAASEWCFVLDNKLVAVCYVDELSDGLSAVYSFYDPDYSQRSLGSFMILSMISQSALRGLPFVYLGYFIKGCRSMQYKNQFRPNEILSPDGNWREFVN